MTTDSDDFPGDDDKRRSDPTQRATRPGKRTTLGTARVVLPRRPAPGEAPRD